jgi:hypothetical protein
MTLGGPTGLLRSGGPNDRWARKAGKMKNK